MNIKDYWYFDALQGTNYDKPIMATMGNNDLLEKKFGQCFANFFTNENQWANSVYHFMVGNTEFICLNSNTETYLRIGSNSYRTQL